MRALYTLMFEGAVQPLPELKGYIQHLQEVALSSTANVVARGIEDGSLRADLDPDSIARLITSALRGIAFHEILLPDRGDVFDCFDDLMKFVDSLAA